MRKIKRRKNKGDTILIDANALAYAAYYTTGNLSYRGEDTGVIFGFLKQLIQIAKILKSSNLIFCWDQGNSYRTINYKGYKHTRIEKRKDESSEEKEDRNNFYNQRVLLAKTILPRIGLRNSFSFENYEGDDLIGQLTNQIKGPKVIVTSDNDAFQLLDRAIIYHIKQKKLFSKIDFIEKYGIHPDQWVMAKAIGGCSGDDIKGIEGVGDPKSPTSKALKYLRGELPSGKVLDRINSKKGQRIIKRNIPLVTVPYMEDIMPEMVIKENTVTRKKLLREFDKFHFVSLMERENFSKWKEVFGL
jgi:5'-3' exonuclease